MSNGPGIGFDDGGNCVATVEPVFPGEGGADCDFDRSEHEMRLKREAAVRVVQFLNRDNALPDEIGRRALLFLHLTNPEGTQRQLAARLKLNETSVSRRLREMRKEFRSASF